MRLGAYLSHGEQHVARVDDDQAILLRQPGDLATLLRAGVDPSVAPGAGPVVDGKPLAPISPGKIVGIGLNYHDHIRETGMSLPRSPLVFAKFPSSVIGPEDSIMIDSTLCERVDWEVELGVVVATRTRNVSVDEALDHVFGYTVANDVSARDLQMSDGQWVRAKSLDTFCPLGPVVLTADEVPDPQALTLRTLVNGEIVQEASTSAMVFSVAELISFCSRCLTLEAGDLLLTGTPWGCGEFMQPPRSLRPGDLLETEIEGIGRLRNPIETVSNPL